MITKRVRTSFPRSLLCIEMIIFLCAARVAYPQSGELFMTHSPSASSLESYTWVYQDNQMQRSWLDHKRREFAMAIPGDTVKKTSHSSDDDGGSEYTLYGIPTGETYPTALYVYDGATDGEYMYGWHYRSPAALLRYDLNWSNPTLVFQLPGMGSQYMGVTYDPITDSVWLPAWGAAGYTLTGCIENYALDGTHLGSIQTDDPNAWGAGMAMDYTDNTLWFHNYNLERYEHYSRDGQFLGSIDGITRIYGAEFQWIPEPGTITALGLCLIVLIGHSARLRR